MAATSPIFDASKDCHLKPGLFPDLRILLSNDNKFTNPIVIDRHVKTPAGLEVGSPHTFSFLMKGKRGDLTIRENYNGDEYQVYTSIARDSFRVFRYDDLDDNGDPSSTFTIHLAIKPEHTLEVNTDGNKKPNPPKRRGDPQFFTTLNIGTILHRERNKIPLVRYVKVIIPEYRKVKLAAAFHVETARKILHQELLTDSTVVPAKFIDLQMNAIRGEADLAKDMNSKLARANVELRFKPLEGYQYRFYAEMIQPSDAPNWPLQGQEQVILQHSREIGESIGIFNIDPTATPGKKDAYWWRGTVFFRHGQPCVALSNVVNSEVAQLLLSHPNIGSIKVSIDDEDDPNVNRAILAVRGLKDVLEKHVNPQYVPKTDIHHNFHIPPTGVFLSKRREMMRSDVAPLTVDNFSDLFSKPEYKLVSDSHKWAIKHAFESEFGITLVQGPPATGKTELLAKLIGFVLKHCTNMPPRQSIVLSAHTNVAVAVACLRYLKRAKDMFNLPESHACLVWTENKAEFGRLTGKDLPRDLANITLDAHCDRIASTNPEKYVRYMIGRDEIKKKGRIESRGMRAQYIKDLKLLIDEVKKQVRVWFCTLATFHQKSPVFGKEKGWSGIDCGLLIIDEASQAHAVAAWLPWHVVNPRRIVFAGDHMQLAPYTLSTEAQWAWRKSLFEQLRENSKVPHIMLDLQFRTRENIYAGTNAFYDGKVKSHSSTAERVLYKKLMEAVKRITFEDAKKVLHKLTMNTHWFDIENGKTISRGETQSSTNELECQFMIGLFGALQHCGIPATECMILTGYQAMHDDLVEAEGKLPCGGTIIKKVDGAQGDEAGIVGMPLVKTAQSGLGFMAQPRRMNVFTSRARDGCYGVGQSGVFMKARDQGNAAWASWFQRMRSQNGAGWIIKFSGPVTFKVDGKPINFQRRSTSTAPPPLPEPSTFAGAEAAAQEDDSVEAPRRSSIQSSSHSRSQSIQSLTQQSGSEPSRSRSGTIRSPGQQPSVLAHDPTRSRSGSIQSPRQQPSTPTHDLSRSRAQSIQSVLQQPLPVRSAQPQFWIDSEVENRIKSMRSRSIVELQTLLRQNIQNFKTDRYKNRWNEFCNLVDTLYYARQANDVLTFNKNINTAKSEGVPLHAVQDAVTLVHGRKLVRDAGGELIPMI